MKRVIPFLLLIALIGSSVQAQNYKVKKLNCNKILVAGRYVAVGDVFAEDDPIVWPSDSAYMVVYSVKKNPERIVLTARQMKGRRCTTVRSFVSSTHLSAQYFPNVPNALFESAVTGDTIYLIDKEKIRLVDNYGSGGNYEIAYRYGTKKNIVSVTYDADNYQLTLKRSHFRGPGLYNVDVLVRNEGNDSEQRLLCQIVVYVLPDWIKL